jgi:hypothetical protein
MVVFQQPVGLDSTAVLERSPEIIRWRFLLTKIYLGEGDQNWRNNGKS